MEAPNLEAAMDEPNIGEAPAGRPDEEDNILASILPAPTPSTLDFVEEDEEEVNYSETDEELVDEEAATGINNATVEVPRSSGTDGSQSRSGKHEKISWRKWVAPPGEEGQRSSRCEERPAFARRDRSRERSRTRLPARLDGALASSDPRRRRSRSRSGRPSRDRDRDKHGGSRGNSRERNHAQARDRPAAAGRRSEERAPPLGPAGPPEYEETTEELRARKERKKVSQWDIAGARAQTVPEPGELLARDGRHHSSGLRERSPASHLPPPPTTRHAREERPPAGREQPPLRNGRAASSPRLPPFDRPPLADETPYGAHSRRLGITDPARDAPPHAYWPPARSYDDMREPPGFETNRRRVVYDWPPLRDGPPYDDFPRERPGPPWDHPAAAHRLRDGPRSSYPPGYVADPLPPLEGGSRRHLSISIERHNSPAVKGRDGGHPLRRMDSRERDRIQDRPPALVRRGSGRADSDRLPDSSRRRIPVSSRQQDAAEKGQRPASRLASTSLPEDRVPDDRQRLSGAAAKARQPERHAGDRAPDSKSARLVEQAATAERVVPGRLARSLDTDREADKRRHEPVPNKAEKPDGADKSDRQAAENSPVHERPGQESRQHGIAAHRVGERRRHDDAPSRAENAGGGQKEAKFVEKVDPVEARPWHMSRERRIEAERAAARADASSKERKPDAEKVSIRTTERRAEPECSSDRSSDRAMDRRSLDAAAAQRHSDGVKPGRDPSASVPSKQERSRSDSESARRSNNARKQAPSNRSNPSNAATDLSSGRTSSGRKEAPGSLHAEDSHMVERERKPLEGSKGVSERSGRRHLEPPRENRLLEPPRGGEGRHHAPPASAGASRRAAANDQDRRQSLPSRADREGADHGQDRDERQRDPRASRATEEVRGQDTNKNERQSQAGAAEKGGSHAADRHAAVVDGRNVDVPSLHPSAEKAKASENRPQPAGAGEDNGQRVVRESRTSAEHSKKRGREDVKDTSERSPASRQRTQAAELSEINGLAVPAKEKSAHSLANGHAGRAADESRPRAKPAVDVRDCNASDRDGKVHRDARPSENPSMRSIVPVPEPSRPRPAAKQPDLAFSRAAVADEQAREWLYLDPKGNVQGPCSIKNFRSWLGRMRAEPGLRREYEEFLGCLVWRKGNSPRMPLFRLLEQ